MATRQRSGSAREAARDSPPLVYINPRPNPNSLNTAAIAAAIQNADRQHTYSPRSSSHGHTNSLSMVASGQLGGVSDSPPSTPLSPRPCVSRKASANRLAQERAAAAAAAAAAVAAAAAAAAAPGGTGSSPAALGLDRTSASLSGHASTTSHDSPRSPTTATIGVTHRRSLSSAMSMSSFPLPRDPNAITPNASAPAGLNSVSPSSSPRHISPSHSAAPFQGTSGFVAAAGNRFGGSIFANGGNNSTSRLNRSSEDTPTTLSPPASSSSLYENDKSKSETKFNTVGPSTSPPRIQPTKTAAAASAAASLPPPKRAATLGPAAGAAVLAMSDSMPADAPSLTATIATQKPDSASHNPPAGAAAAVPAPTKAASTAGDSIRSSPSTKKVTAASKWAATQEMKEWGSNFWVVISDPNSGQSFFANPHTGECKWEVPSGTFVLPPNPDGQWMEFFDEQHSLPYFFHSGQNRSQWERPPGFVIPLTTIQEVNMGRYFTGPAGLQRSPRVSISSEGGRSELDVSILNNNNNSSSNGNGNNNIAPASPNVTFAEPSTAEKRRSIQPPPPAQSPSIDQVLAYRRSLHLGKNELLAQALATNLIGIGAPHPDASAGSSHGHAEKDIVPAAATAAAPTSSALAQAGTVAFESSAAATTDTVQASGKKKETKRPSTGGSTSSDIATTGNVAGPTSSSSKNPVSAFRKILGHKFSTSAISSSAHAGGEMEHVREADEAGPGLQHQQQQAGARQGSFQQRDSLPSQPRTHGPNASVSSSSTINSLGQQPGGSGERDDTASVSSAGTDFMSQVASGRLFGGPLRGSSGLSDIHEGGGGGGAGYTVSGPGGPGGSGCGPPGTPGSMGSSPVASAASSIRESVGSAFSRPSSSLNGGFFAPIAEEHPTGITVKITRPSTSTDGASLASKSTSGRWTPEFGGAIIQSGSEGGGAGGPILRERESLRSLRSPPTSARAAAFSQASGFHPTSLTSPRSNYSSFDSVLAAGTGNGGGGGGGGASGRQSPAQLLSPPTPNLGLAHHQNGNLQHNNNNNNTSISSSWAADTSGSSAHGSMAWSASWRSGNGSSQGGVSSARASSPASSQSQHQGSVLGYAKAGRGGHGGLTSSPHGSNDDARFAAFDREIANQNASAASQALKSPKLFNALRFRLRSTSSPGSNSTHHGSQGSSTGHGKEGVKGGVDMKQGVMHIADKGLLPSQAEEADLPPETPEEAYNRRRMMNGLGSSSSSGTERAYGSTPSTSSAAPHLIPSRSGSLNAFSQLLTKGPVGVSANTPASAGVGGRSTLGPTPGLAFSPNSINTSPSLGSEGSHQSGVSGPGFGVLPGSYGLGVGLEGDGPSPSLDAASTPRREPFRPSGVTDVVVNSKQGRLAAASAAANGLAAGAGSADSSLQQQQRRDPDVLAFDALLKGYANTESQIMKNVVVRAKAATSSPNPNSNGGLPSRNGFRF